MNMQFLGDALDHWKGSIFSRLRKAGLLEDFSVDPMLTDAEDWNTADFRLYADLLQVSIDQILCHKIDLKEDRSKYFAEIEHSGDLFLDPDTGITSKGGTPIRNYIKIDEVHRLLDCKLSRMVCVYQHIRAMKTPERINSLVSALKEVKANFNCCSYESPSVAMLFLSRDQNRIKGVYQYFTDYLGRHASTRVRIW